MRPNWSHIFLGHFGGEQNEKNRRRKKRYGIYVWKLVLNEIARICME